jgi:5,10-methylenetetrahydromethanopterin reductase
LGIALYLGYSGKRNNEISNEEYARRLFTISRFYYNLIQSKQIHNHLRLLFIRLYTLQIPLKGFLMSAGFLYDGMWPLPDFLKVAELADLAGLNSIWIAEHFTYRDAFTCSAFTLEHTRQTRVIPGPISPFAKHPMAIAMAAATLVEMGGDRFGLLLGTGDLATQAQFGLNVQHPVGAMKDALEIIRSLCAGKTVNTTHQNWEFDNVHMEIDPCVSFPIYLAAKRKRMFALAYHQADGIVLSAGTSPAYIKLSLQTAAKSESLAKPFTAGILLSSVADDRRVAYEQARQTLAYLLCSPDSQEDWDLNDLKIDHLTISQAVHNQEKDHLSNLISDKVVETLCAAGTPADFRSRLADYLEAGIDLPVIWPVGDPQTKLKTLKIAIEMCTHTLNRNGYR